MPKVEKTFKAWVVDGAKVVVMLSNLALVYDYSDISLPPQQFPLTKFIQYPEDIGGYV